MDSATRNRLLKLSAINKSSGGMLNPGKRPADVATDVVTRSLQEKLAALSMLYAKPDLWDEIVAFGKGAVRDEYKRWGAGLHARPLCGDTVRLQLPIPPPDPW
jgi:hypothetical protein